MCTTWVLKGRCSVTLTVPCVYRPKLPLWASDEKHATKIWRILHIDIRYLKVCSQQTADWIFYYIGYSYSIEFSWNIFCMYFYLSVEVPCVEYLSLQARLLHNMVPCCLFRGTIVPCKVPMNTYLNTALLEKHTLSEDRQNEKYSWVYMQCRCSLRVTLLAH